MRVLVACEYSGIVRDAFAALGHDAWSCDLLPTERPGKHIHGDVRHYTADGWDLLIAHPPCTYLSRAGYHWCNRPDSAPGVLPLKGRPRLEAMEEARDFFNGLLHASVPRICVENPLPIVHARLPAPTQTIQPWQFGHGETKATCLWLKNLPPLTPTNIVDGRANRVHHMSPGPNRWKERSRTYSGIAVAMAWQWGNV